MTSTGRTVKAEERIVNVRVFYRGLHPLPHLHRCCQHFPARPSARLTHLILCVLLCYDNLCKKAAAAGKRRTNPAVGLLTQTASTAPVPPTGYYLCTKFACFPINNSNWLVWHIGRFLHILMDEVGLAPFFGGGITLTHAAARLHMGRTCHQLRELARKGNIM